MAFMRLEPFGEFRADLRAGIVAATVANAARSPDRPPFKTTDFMPDFSRADKPAAAAAGDALLLAKFELMAQRGFQVKVH